MLNARYYDGANGRFLLEDPTFLGLPDIELLADPQQLNGYSYARNNPLRFLDPLGLFKVGTGEIEKGDTLSGIAKILSTDYNTPVTYQQLAAANNIAGPRYTIYAGSYLKSYGPAPTNALSAGSTSLTAGAQVGNVSPQLPSGAVPGIASYGPNGMTYTVTQQHISSGGASYGQGGPIDPNQPIRYRKAERYERIAEGLDVYNVTQDLSGFAPIVAGTLLVPGINAPVAVVTRVTVGIEASYIATNFLSQGLRWKAYDLRHYGR